jgi:hypothetical protein
MPKTVWIFADGAWQEIAGGGGGGGGGSGGGIQFAGTGSVYGANNHGDSLSVSVTGTPSFGVDTGPGSLRLISTGTSFIQAGTEVVIKAVNASPSGELGDIELWADNAVLISALGPNGELALNANSNVFMESGHNSGDGNTWISAQFTADTTGYYGNVYIQPERLLFLQNIPTSDPGVSDAVWNSGGTLVFSGSTAGGGVIDGGSP